MSLRSLSSGCSSARRMGAGLVLRRGQIRHAAKENVGLSERIVSLEARRDPAPRSAKNIPLTDADENDNFQAIKRVGLVFAKRLRDAGVLTFEKLAGLKSSQLEQILETLYFMEPDP